MDSSQGRFEESRALVDTDEHGQVDNVVAHDYHNISTQGLVARLCVHKVLELFVHRLPFDPQEI